MDSRIIEDDSEKRTQSASAKTVVHFFSSASGYRWFLDQILTLKAGGIDVECIVGQEGWLTEQLRARGIPTFVFDLSLPWTLRDLRDLPSRMVRFVQLLLFLQSRRYSASQSHLFESAVIGRLSAWIAGIPVRIRMSESPAYLASPGAKKIELLLQKLDTTTVASSELIRDQYVQAGLDEQSVPIIYYGASAKTFNGRMDRDAVRTMLSQIYGIPAQGPLIGMVAHFYAEWPSSDFTVPEHWGVPVKLHTLFIDAAQVVLKSRPNAIFVLAGSAFTEVDKTYFEEVQRYVRSRGLADNIFFTGMISNIEELIAGLDLSVQCSSFDNLGGSLEAMAMACPVIATNVGAFSEAIQHGSTGLLVDKTVSSLSENILACLDNPMAAREMGQRGQQLVNDKFRAEHSAEKLKALYRRESANPPVGGSMVGTVLRLLSLLPVYCWIVYVLCHRDIMSRLSEITWPHMIRQWMHCQKRVADLFISSIVLAVLSPCILLTMTLCCRSSFQPLFKYVVCGKDRRPVEIYTWWPLQMKDNKTLEPCAINGWHSADRGGQLSATIRRKFWWLPTMYNVIMGQMSLIGPCLRASDFQSTGQSWPICRPGILGWTQSMDNLSSKDTELRDSLYAVSFGPLLDLKVLLKLVLRKSWTNSSKAVFKKDTSALPFDVRESVV